jgi:hypothetical protein
MADSQTLVFRAALAPKLSKDFEILSPKSLHDLARAIVEAFGFDFETRGRRF